MQGTYFEIDINIALDRVHNLYGSVHNINTDDGSFVYNNNMRFPVTDTNIVKNFYRNGFDGISTNVRQLPFLYCNDFIVKLLTLHYLDNSEYPGMVVDSKYGIDLRKTCSEDKILEDIIRDFNNNEYVGYNVYNILNSVYNLNKNLFISTKDFVLDFNSNSYFIEFYTTDLLYCQYIRDLEEENSMLRNKLKELGCVV